MKTASLDICVNNYVIYLELSVDPTHWECVFGTLWKLDARDGDSAWNQSKDSNGED